MLYLDGISLSKIKEELKEILKGKKINRIFKNNEHSISLFFGKTELLFSCMPNFPVCYITTNKEKSILDEASNILSNLRRYLMNAILIEIEQLGFDRILVVHFSKINELGVLKKYKLYFECAGKLLNLVLVDEENRVVDSLKKFSLSEKLDRRLFRGEKYIRPKYTEKLSPLALTKKDFENLCLNREKKEEKFSMKIEGIGKILENNIKTYEEFSKILKDKVKAKIYIKDKKIKLATVLDIKLEDFDELKEFETFNEMINFYVSYEFYATSFSILQNKLLSVINKKIKKVNKILLLIEKDIVNSVEIESIKEQADIVAANLYSLKKGMEVLETFDFYNNKEIKIDLDSLLSPKANLDKLYKKYNKAKRSLENAKRRRKEMKEELTYLESTQLFLKNSESINSLYEIEEELIKLNYIRVINKKKNTKLKKEVKYGILEIDESLILYGRNNLENDNLTFKVANKNDYWFHVKDIPSSHVIVKTNNLTETLIKKASEISAYYTKLNFDEKVIVEYTQKKYVNKPKGGKPGFVTYTNQKSIAVEKKEIK